MDIVKKIRVREIWWSGDVLMHEKKPRDPGIRNAAAYYIKKVQNI